MLFLPARMDVAWWFDVEQLALTVADTFTRTRRLDSQFSYRANDAVRALEQVCPSIGYLKTSRADQGSELVCRDLDLRAYAKGVTLDFSGLKKRPTALTSKPSTAASGRSNLL